MRNEEEQSSCLQHRFVEKEAEQRVREYKYSGVDHSLLYNHIFTHIANKCIEYTPTWLAPNVITLLGFICVLVPHIVLFAHATLPFSGPMPTWVCVLVATLHLIYMNFDNMDGKQARKTGNSSPLGMLFDHQTDALVLALQSLNIAQVLQLGTFSLASPLVFITASLPFFTTTLEEYYTGVLYLPLINGAAEGCFIVSLIFYFTAAVGNSWWIHPAGFSLGISRAELFLYCFFAGAVMNALFNYYSIAKKKCVWIIDAIMKVILLVCLYFTMIFLQRVLPQTIYQKNLHMLMYILGLNFAKLVGCLQLAHISSSHFRQWSITILITLLSLNATGLFTAYLVDSADQQTTLQLATDLFIFTLLWSIASYVHFVVNVSQQMCGILSIRVFCVKDPSIQSPEQTNSHQESLPDEYLEKPLQGVSDHL